jgi:quinol monooxygenase YgiN
MALMLVTHYQACSGDAREEVSTKTVNLVPKSNLKTNSDYILTSHRHEIQLRARIRGFQILHNHSTRRRHNIDICGETVRYDFLLICGRRANGHNDRYINQAAFDAHSKAPSSITISNFRKTRPELFSAPITHHTLLPAISYTRPTINEHSDPYIVYGSLKYQVGTAEAAIVDFTKVGEFSEMNEAGTLSYTVSRDMDEENTVRTLEVYESERALWDPHAKSAVVQNGIKRQGDTRIERDLKFLQKIGGYLYK